MTHLDLRRVLLSNSLPCASFPVAQCICTLLDDDELSNLRRPIFKVCIVSISGPFPLLSNFLSLMLPVLDLSQFVYCRAVYFFCSFALITLCCILFVLLYTIRDAI